KNRLECLIFKIGKIYRSIDFKNIEFIDSSGIGCIISLVKTAKSNHSEIKLCNISSEVMDVLELLHLPMILDIEPDLASALTSF
uniref:STAS domain-containing protein n=1 Tax=Odoribacter splanchnicus TaxID=28118 RepID=UPI001898C6A2